MADPIVPNVVVSMPAQNFTLARSFKAAANGKIYIGQIDTDPTIPENQIQVYVQNEDDSLVPIAQPIVINAGGYPVYSGQISKFVTVEGHSMAVYDAYNVQQFYFPNVLKYDPDQLRRALAQPDGAKLVGYRDGTVYSALDSMKDQLAQLGESEGSKLVGYRDTTVYNALDRLYRAASGVVISPQYQPVQGSPSVKLTGGIYSFNGITVLGTEQTVLTTGSSICVVIKSDGVYEARDRYPFDGSVLVAHCKNGTIVEIIGNSNKSAFGIQGTAGAIPWMPGEIRRVGERIPIFVGLNTDGSLSYKTDYDVAVKKATTGVTYYVDRVNGSDTTGDGTQANPFQRIKFAIEKTPLARTIMIRATGEYTRDFTWNVSIVDRDLDFIGYDGRPVLSNVYPNPAWVAVPGSAGVYSFTAGLVLTVADYKNLDVYGHAQVLTAVNSVAACAAQPGSRYTASGTTYIHLFDSRTPDADARLILEMTNGRVQDNSKIYIENLEFRDSFRGFQAEVRDANKNCYVYAKNCIFGLTATVNSYNSLGANSIMQNCVAQYGMQDAFNYHSDTLGLGKKPWFIEINCIGRWSGFDLLPNNNGSTAHDGTVGVRVNGEYYGTYGRVVHDVHDGTVTANFGCYAHDSSRSDFIGGACFTAGQGSDTTGKAKVYLFGCGHSGPNASITRDGLSEVWIFDTPIGANAQYTIGNPYTFIQ
ncbi:phage head-binding domain-containing protein [Serratia fonticola]|uniref:phage head-binding domain-containing protein n=1 Tax=Serratia fonticola TaxID=47917 RepID=UPI0021ADF86B|nr:phage head-binding domain-containing protein [Serratia fonticola]